MLVGSFSLLFCVVLVLLQMSHYKL